MCLRPDDITPKTGGEGFWRLTLRATDPLALLRSRAANKRHTHVLCVPDSRFQIFPALLVSSWNKHGGRNADQLFFVVVSAALVPLLALALCPPLFLSMYTVILGAMEGVLQERICVRGGGEGGQQDKAPHHQRCGEGTDRHEHQYCQTRAWSLTLTKGFTHPPRLLHDTRTEFIEIHEKSPLPQLCVCTVLYHGVMCKGWISGWRGDHVMCRQGFVVSTLMFLSCLVVFVLLTIEHGAMKGACNVHTGTYIFFLLGSTVSIVQYKNWSRCEVCRTGRRLERSVEPCRVHDQGMS